MEDIIMLSKNYEEIVGKCYYLKFPIEYGLQIFAKYYKVNGGYSKMTRAEKERLDTIHQNLIKAGVFTGKNTSWEDFELLRKAI